MYQKVADVCRRVDAGESLKKIFYGDQREEYFQFHDIRPIRALADITLRNKNTIDDLIGRSELSGEIVFNEVWMARVLVAELLFGKKSYHCKSKIEKKVYQYKEELKELLGDLKRKEITFIPRYCRINTLNCTKEVFHSEFSKNYTLKEIGGKSELSYEDFLKIVRQLKKHEYIQDYHFADIYLFHPKANITSSVLYQEKKIILQDKASCLVAPLLGPTPGSLMIDMCAAPGFKTQHLSTVSGSSGLILAIDIDKERYSSLANTRINYSLTNVMTFNADSLHLPEIATNCIEYILLDAPCSGSGVVQNYDYGTDNRNCKKRLASLHNLQAYLLRTALTKYPSARRLVYSTCSIFEEENEAVIDELLDIAQENQFILVNLKNRLQDFGTGLNKYKSGTSCIRLMPEQSCTNGFFIALFERTNPLNPVPRIEFYKNLNDIIAGISCRKKRKADESISNTDGEVDGKKKIAYKNVEMELNQTYELVENQKEELENHPVQDNLNESINQSPVKKSNQSSESSSEESSSSEEELKNIVSPKQPDRPEIGSIRVVKSPLLKNPVNPAKESSEDSDEEEDSDEDEEEEEHDNDGDVEKPNVLQKTPDLKSFNNGMPTNKDNLAHKVSSNNTITYNLGEKNENKNSELNKSFDHSFNKFAEDNSRFNEGTSSEPGNEPNEPFSVSRYYFQRNENHERNRPFNRGRDDLYNNFRRKLQDNYVYRGGERGNWRGKRGRDNFKRNHHKSSESSQKKRFYK